MATTTLNSNATVNNGAIVPNDGMANSSTPASITPSLDPTLASKADVGTTINPVPLSSSQNSTPILPATPTTSSDYVNSLQVGNPATGTPSATSLQADVTSDQGNVDETTKQINQLNQELGFQSQDVTTLQNSQNVTGLQNNLSDLNTQFAQMKADYNTKYNQIAGQGIATPFKQGQLALEQVQAQTDLGAKAAEIQAAQGNLNTAFSTIDKVISEKYKPIQDQLDAESKYYTMNMDKLTKAQQILATRQLDINEAKKLDITNQQKNVSDSIATIKDAVGKVGLSTSDAFGAISDILGGKISPSQALANLGLSQDTSNNGAGSGAKAVATAAGISDTTVPLSQAITNVGLDTIVNGIIANEGGSKPGVQNNPGNIEYDGLPGQTDSGVKKADGGTFANYSTFEAGKTAIANLVQNAADGKSKAYGSTPSFESFMNTYTNTKPVDNAPGTTGNSTIDATVPGYSTTIVGSTGMTQAAIDQRALNIAIGNETAPKQGSGISGVANRAIQNRVGELNASGNIAANKAQLKSLSSSLTDQTNYLNTTQRAYNTANDNLGVLTKLMQDNGINDSSIPLINQITNNIKSGIADPGSIAAFKANLQGLRAEYSQVLAKGGTRSVETDNAAASLIPDNISPAQLQQVATQLKLEGGNAISEAQKQVQTVQDGINNIISPKSSKPADIDSLRTKYGY